MTVRDRALPDAGGSSGFAVSYAVLAVRGPADRPTDGQGLSLIWPGARRRHAVAARGVAAPPGPGAGAADRSIHGARCVWLTGATPDLVAAGRRCRVTCQTWRHRACSCGAGARTLLGAGRHRSSFRSPRSLAYTVPGAAARRQRCVGAAASAPSPSCRSPGRRLGRAGCRWRGSTGTSPASSWSSGASGTWRGSGHTQHVAPRTQGGSRRRARRCCGSSPRSSLVVVFLQPLPIVFLVMPLAVWSAARFPTFLAATPRARPGGGRPAR